MKKELHLFIVWKNALDIKDKIIKDIKSTFNIRNQFMISWSDRFFSSNLSRFYGTKLPDGSAKEVHCGHGEFLLIIVEDNNPKYEERTTSKATEIVNSNMFDKKTLYREWTGGGHKIHATNNQTEFNHDITLLLGVNTNDFIKKYKPSKTVKKINKDVIGAETWNSAEEMFYVLNNCTTYSLLRNWESLPEEIYVNEHNDIDLICESKEETAFLLNAKKAQELDYRVQYYVDVNGRTANFDLRYIGDNYYTEDIEKRILDNRIFNKKGFYVLCNEDYFYTLLYHALIHKPSFKEDYKVRLSKMKKTFTLKIANDTFKSMKFLEEWLAKNEYIVIRPIDKSVYFNEENITYLKKILFKDDSDLLKLEQNNFELKNKLQEISAQRDLYKNEFEKVINSKGWKFLNKLRKIKTVFTKK